MTRIWAAGLGLAAWGCLGLLLAGFGGPLDPRLDVLAHMRLHLIVAGAVLVLLARGWGARAPALAVVAVGLAGLGPVWHGLPQGPAGGQTVTVLFGNIYSRNRQVPDLDAALVGYGADVVALTEMAPGLRDRTSQISTAYRNYYRPVMRRQSLPGDFWSHLALTPVPNGFDSTGQPVAAVTVVGAAPGPQFTLVAVHLPNPKFIDQQLHLSRALAEVTDGLPRPLVLVGDFNATPWSLVLAEAARASGTRLVGGLRLTWRGQHRMKGFLVPETLGLPIDHLLVSPGVTVEEVRTVPLPGSDHMGLLARLRLPPV